MDGLLWTAIGFAAAGFLVLLLARAADALENGRRDDLPYVVPAIVFFFICELLAAVLLVCGWIARWL